VIDLHRAAIFLLSALGLSGCLHRRPPPPVLSGHPHYELGAPYQADGYWFYPSEAYTLDETGVAAVDTGTAGLTADGEVRDQMALTAAMQTIQLPAIVDVTNLENGRQISVRVNDRGPASPGRVIAVSPRAALLLAMPAGGAARVRLRIDEQLSHRLVEQMGGGPKLTIAAVPQAAITAQALPPPGQGQAGPAQTIGGVQTEQTGARVPDRLPEQIRMTYANPGQLVLQCGVFGRFTYANAVAARLSGLGASVVSSRDGRQRNYVVQAGPYPTIARADAALDQALRAGVIDARITVQ